MTNRSIQKSIRNLGISFLFASLCGYGFAASTTKITVNGLVCDSCVPGIEKRLSSMPQTKAVFVDLRNKLIAVEAKDGTTLNAKLITQHLKEAGYNVIKMEASTQSVEEVKTSMKGKK